MATSRNRPNAGLTDNLNGGGPNRANWYGDGIVQPMGGGDWGFADEGSAFVAANATLATGIAGHAAPVVADTDTKPFVHIYNGGQRHVILSHLFLEVTAAGTAGTINYAVVYVDNEGESSRSSGGTALTVNSTRSDAPFTSGAVVFAGAVVAAPTSSKKVGQQIVREVIPVVQDTIQMVFGAPNMAATSLTTAGTATNHKVLKFAPVVIAPGGNCGIALIRPSQSAAASYQVELAFFER